MDVESTDDCGVDDIRDGTPKTGAREALATASADQRPSIAAND
jgi:hypothetical protein